jgi:hypothetical protein
LGTARAREVGHDFSEKIIQMSKGRFEIEYSQAFRPYQRKQEEEKAVPRYD